MTKRLRTQVMQDPLVVDFADRTRHCGQPRSFFETIDERPCPIFVDSIRRAYSQKGGTLDAPPQLIAEVVIHLAFDQQPPATLWNRIQTRIRRG